VEIEGYTIRGEIARGGMGVVYRAHDPRLGRDVALKVVSGENVSEAHLQRFLREGEITARLDHPGIVRVHASGLHDGRAFLVYELVEGARTLADVLPGVPPGRRLVLLRDAATALGFAHSQGVVHRDVKPENVLVDLEGRVRVADFGIASAQGLTRMTRTGPPLGTPQYMAPEQIGADRDQVGAPTDVWALGVMLYETLTGQIPFPGKNLVTLSVQILNGLIEPPSRLAPDVSPGLDAICLRALAADPAARYPDGEAFAADLRAVLRGEPPQALLTRRRGGSWGKAQALACALLVVVGGAALLQAAGGPPPPTAGPASRLPPETPKPTPTGVDTPPRDAEARRERVSSARARPLARRRILKGDGDGRVRFLGPRRFFCWSRKDVGLGVWELRQGVVEPVMRLGESEGLYACTDLIPAPSGGYLALGSGRGWQLEGDPLTLRPLFEVQGTPHYMAISPDGERLALASDKEVQLYDRRGRRLPSPPLASSRVRRLEFTSDGDQLVWLAASASDGLSNVCALYAWNMAPDAEPSRAPLVGYSTGMQLVPNRPQAWVGCGSTIMLFELGKKRPAGRLVGASAGQGELLDSLRGPPAHSLGTVKSIWRRPDGSRLFSLSSRRNPTGDVSELRAWDLPSRDEIGAALVVDRHWKSLAVSPDEELLLLSNDDGEVAVWWAPALTEAPRVD
jgi:hypothetical protein